MSDQTPARRRKIAGERRRGRVVSPEGDEPAPRPSADSPGPPGPPAPSDPGGAGRSFGHVPGWLLAGLAVLLIAAVAFDLVFAFRSHNADVLRTRQSAAITSAFNAAPAAAEKAATRSLGYDYKTLQTDADEAKSFMTPSYAQKFQKTVDDLLRAPADQVKAHVEADVKASGVVSATPSKVDVMLFIDQTSTTTARPAPQTYLNRVVFTMVRSGDRWLVDDITAL
jgi:Mce-associated membrane protein